jgi:hypothetical protein
LDANPIGRASPAPPCCLVVAVSACLGLAVAGTACEATRVPPERPAPGVLAATTAPAAPTTLAGVRIHGGPELRLLTQRALERLLSTQVGARLRERLESGTLAGPLTIELNLRGDDFTAYRVPGEEIGETVVFDPWTLPNVETQRGLLPATRETVLAHELGHAVLKLETEDDVIREVENPLRQELGLPLRVRF